MALTRSPLRRSAPPQRKPMTRKTPFRPSPVPQAPGERPEPAPMDLATARIALQRQLDAAAADRPAFTEPAPLSKSAPKAPNGFPEIVRRTILDRDHETCQMCGTKIVFGAWLGYSLQHRSARGSGGSRSALVNGPANGLTLCGSATTGCHGKVEGDHTGLAEAKGMAVASWADPATVPVHTYRGWFLLDERGAAHPTAAPPTGNAHDVARRRAPQKKEHITS